jgi:hypothetical protein
MVDCRGSGSAREAARPLTLAAQGRSPLPRGEGKDFHCGLSGRYALDRYRRAANLLDSGVRNLVFPSPVGRGWPRDEAG